MWTYDTQLCADCVEWCPWEDESSGTSEKGNMSTITVGTYQLMSSDAEGQGANRKGTIISMKLDSSTGESCEVTQQIETAAIFDIKWSHSLVSGRKLLGAATAAGDLAVYQQGAGGLDLHISAKAGSPEQPLMCLSLDWSNRLELQAAPSIAVSHNKGCLSQWSLSPTALVNTSTWKGHEHEVWCVATNPHSPSTLLSGADDCKLKMWDLRAEPSVPSSTSSWMMGVTTIQFSPHEPHYVAVGSYDETVTLLDSRQMRRPLASLPVGGGVWRIKHHPHTPCLLGLACMHDGFKVANVDYAAAQLSIEHEHHDPHSSLAYGVDWCYSARADGHDILGCCSFYDHLFSLWRVG